MSTVLEDGEVGRFAGEAVFFIFFPPWSFPKKIRFRPALDVIKCLNQIIQIAPYVPTYF